MALVLKDRVQETSTTTGTGTFTLAGAVTQFQTFSSAIGNGNTTYYTAYLAGGTEWEVGIGTVGAGTLSRDTILASSNAGNIVTFSAGTKYVFCDYPAGKAVYTDASGSISQPIVNISGITGAISTVDTIAFDTAYTTPLTTGQLGWDGNNTLGFGMSGGNIVQQIGLQTYVYGKATAAITKGQLIKKTGANGSSGVITFAPTTANMTDGQAIIGVAAENIALNGFGYIISTGNIRGFNTTGSSSGETWADGDVLYYNPTGNGLMTNVKPTAPNIKVEVAIVTNAGSGSSGSVAVEILHGSVLGGTDSNVQLTTPSNGQILTYDGTNTYWKNTTLTAGTGITTTPSSTGVITITNTAPDQTVAISAGTGISVTGTYPNFTVTNTSPSSGGTVTSITAGTGLSGGTITTSGTIALANTTVTAGSYTNASLTVDAQGRLTAASSGTAPVTSVTGTSPIVSSGGTTPAISIPQANGSTNGFLSSTDWTTFNNKGSGTVTSVGGTGTVNGITLTGTVTSSGSLTLGGTLSNVSLATQVTGTLPVANGGTGITSFGSGIATWLGTPSSANLAAAVTDETGSGSLVFATSPTLVTPILGTPTSGNLSNCTADGTNAVGYLNIPQNSQSAAYTLVLGDAGKHIFHPSADTTARTFTIPANSSVAFPIGTAVTFINQNGAGVITIAITSDTMRLAGAGTTGSRTLAANGVATAIKITSTEWIISGTGLT